MRRPTLCRRLPALVYRGGAGKPIVPPKARSGLGALAGDLELIDEVLEPSFQRLDAAALRAQNSFRLLRLLLIFGGALATLLGTWQAASSDGSEWAGLTEGVLGALLAGLAALLQARGFHHRYLATRLGAERLRSECFLFLARTEPRDDPAAARVRLEERVLEIEQETEA